jgi:Cys-tRNA(Pro)/Cys-tRNA(Cys) deacylase
VSTGTPALEHLARAKVPHRVHRYEAPTLGGRGSSRGERASYGEAAAAALSIPTSQMFKSLVVGLEPAPAPQGASDARRESAGIVLLPVDREANLKLVARAFGARSASLLDSSAVTRITGYVVGGVSPFGTKRQLPVVADEALLSTPRIFLSAGQRGWAIELAGDDLVRELRAVVAPVVAQG